MGFLRSRSKVVLIGISTILLAANICLIVQNLQLRNAVAQTKQLVTDEGFKFSPLKIKGLDGNEETFDFSPAGVNTLLLVFSPSCQYCVQEYPYWKELVKNLDKERWRVLAVTTETNLDKIKDHVAEFDLTDMKVGSFSAEDARGARLLYTPMTLVVDPNGEVKKVWPGLWKKGFDLPK
jgi:peroxiredoxin